MSNIGQKKPIQNTMLILTKNDVKRKKSLNLFSHEKASLSI